MNLFLTYPHGLGDCLMLTPSLREYYDKYKSKIHVAILKRFETSKIFENCDYIEKVHYVPDPWNDFKNSGVGFKEVKNIGKKIANENNIINVKFLDHPPPTHKILRNAELLGIKLSSTQMDVFISNDDKIKANKIIKDLVGDNEFGFIQSKTGAGKNKDLPKSFGKKWLKKNKKLNYFIEIGDNLKFNECNINVQFEILRKANAMCVPDSVFYHAASAMNKDVDFVYFGRGKDVYGRVGNLNKNIKENVSYKIPKT